MTSRRAETPQPRRKKAAMPLVGAGLVLRRVRVPAREVVFVKGILEASEGLAAVFAQKGGDLTIATSASQISELDRVLADLASEIGALVEPPAEREQPGR